MKKKIHTNWEETPYYVDQTISKRHNQKNDQFNNNESLIIQCSSCKGIITLDKPIKTSFKFICPQCGHKMKIKKNKPSSEKRKESKTQKNPQLIKIKKFLFDNSIGLILITIGLIYLIQPTMNNIKISFTLILIATFLLFLITSEQTTTTIPNKPSTILPFHKRRLHMPPILKKIKKFNEKIRQIPLSTRISIVLIFWTLLLYVITADIETYFILVFIGILITRELTDLYTPDLYKKRLNGYIIIFLFTYIILISHKIMEILAT